MLPIPGIWLNELITEPTASAASISTRDGCSVRKVNMTISLAFLAPDLVKASRSRSSSASGLQCDGDVDLAGRDDTEVYAYAWRENRVQLTHDGDFLDDK